MIKPETITYIAGVARSGTSWLGQIFDSSPEVRFRFQPFFAYEFKNWVNEDSTAEQFQHLLANMYETETPFLTQQKKREDGIYPIFKKNKRTQHLVFKENRYQYIIEPMMRKCPEMKLVGIIRNPNAVLNSWMKNSKEFPPGSDPLEEWRFGECKNLGREDFFGYYKWKESAGIFLDLKDKWPERVFILRYEHLVKKTVFLTKKMFNFCGITYGQQTESFLAKSNSRNIESYYSVFKDKSVVNQWKKELDPYITAEIEHDLIGTRLEQFINTIIEN